MLIRRSRCSEGNRTPMGSWAAALVCLLLAAVPALAQLGQGRMQGKVTDMEGNPLEGVEVTAYNPKITPSTLTAVTDENGNWAILGLTSDVWTFTFEKEGYFPREVQARVRMLQRNPDLDVRLEKAEGAAVAGAPGGIAGPELFEEGNRLFGEGDYAGAVARWEEFAAANPAVYQVYVNIGNAYRRMGEPDKARAAYEKVLEQDPHETRALYNLGELAVEEKDFGQALAYFERVVEASPEDPAVYYNVAEIYFQQGLADRAVEYYQRALEIDPGYLPALLQIAYAYVNLRDTAQAIAAFERFLEVAPEDNPDVRLVRDIVAALKSSS